MASPNGLSCEPTSNHIRPPIANHGHSLRSGLSDMVVAIHPDGRAPSLVSQTHTDAFACKLNLSSHLPCRMLPFVDKDRRRQKDLLHRFLGLCGGWCESITASCVAPVEVLIRSISDRLARAPALAMGAKLPLD